MDYLMVECRFTASKYKGISQMPGKEIDESRVERIAKQIVGMGFKTSRVEYDVDNDVRPTVTNFLDQVYNYVANLQFDGNRLPLQTSFRTVIPDFNVTYTKVPKPGGTLSQPITPHTTQVSIGLSVQMEYRANGTLDLTGNTLSAKTNYNGTLYAEIYSRITLGRRAMRVTTPDPICNVVLATGQPNSVTLDDRAELVDCWLDEIDRMLRNKFRNNAHTEHSPT